jgi:hypothetical protein
MLQFVKRLYAFGQHYSELGVPVLQQLEHGGFSNLLYRRLKCFSVRRACIVGFVSGFAADSCFCFQV